MALELRTGTKMPLVGLGTWKIPKDVCTSTVKHALAIGYRLLDCAAVYGNEQEVGEGIKQSIAEGVVKREDIFVTSKLWNTCHARVHVKDACKKTLSDLGLSYLDLYLIHFPISLKFVDFSVRYPAEWDYDPAHPGCVFEDISTRETWEVMEELVAEGLVKNIGVSNFNNQHIMDLMKYAKIKPAALQVELHPYLAQPQLLQYCQSKDVNIAVTAYSSFGGISYVSLGVSLAQTTVNLLEHPIVQEIASNHKKTTSQVLLRWAIQLNLAIIPKSISVQRLKENFDVLNWALGEKDMEQLKKLNTGIRFNDPADFANYPIFG